VRRAKRHGGQALVEFALVALVLYMLLATTVELGRLVFSAQALQDASRVAAREIALTPLLPETANLGAALQDPTVKARIFDEQYLVVDLSTVPNGDVDAFFQGKPLVNQMLRPLMIFETVTLGGGGGTKSYLHYPGALVTNNTTGVTTVVIPLVNVSQNPVSSPPRLQPYDDDATNVQWIPVVEEVLQGPTGTVSAFPASQGGIVALRINYPYQAAMLSGFKPQTPTASDPNPPNMSNPIIADNEAAFDSMTPTITAGGTTTTYTYLTQDDPTVAGTYAGRAGLGRQFGFTMTVRPFRRVVSMQAVFRREIDFR